MSVVLRAMIGVLFLSTASAADDLRFYSIGSGNIDGGYYDAARAICRTVNRPGGDSRCSPEPTTGSLYNIAALRDLQIDFALVQSDWHRSAYEGTDTFADEGPMTELRSVMSLYPESVTILVRRDSGIKNQVGLLGKRVDVGHPSSGRHATLARLLAMLDVDQSSFAAVTELSDGSAMEELCQGRIDAVVLIVGHPNAAVGRVLRECDVEIVPFSGPAIDEVFGETTDYVKTTIPRGAYPELDVAIPSYAVTATLVTRADMNPGIVADVVGSTLASLDQLKSQTPLLASVNIDGMSTRGLTAPLHPAAAAAFDAFAAGQGATQ